MSLVCTKQLVLALHLECYSKRQRSIYTARSSFPLTCHLLIIILLTSAPIPHNIWDITLSCFDTVFQRPYRYPCLIAIEFSPVTGYGLKIVKIDITKTTIDKKTLKLIKAEFCVT